MKTMSKARAHSSATLRRHPRAGGDPFLGPRYSPEKAWIPACAGMTLRQCRHERETSNVRIPKAFLYQFRALPLLSPTIPQQAAHRTAKNFVHGGELRELIVARRDPILKDEV
jgi:hypothetical protein